MTIDELLHAGACEQARAIARGELTANELLQAQYAAIAQHNPRINAFIALAERPGEIATAGASPLAGSTFGVKDNFDVAELPTAAGLRALAHVAPRDAMETRISLLAAPSSPYRTQTGTLQPSMPSGTSKII